MRQAAATDPPGNVEWMRHRQCPVLLHSILADSLPFHCPTQVIDTYWLHAALACIGEQFEDGDEICGIVANIRAKQLRLSVWTKTCSNEAAQVRACV